MNCIKSGIMGQIVGDALGVPVEFLPRGDRDESPVCDMIGYGSHNLPPGSWSDDSSLILATIDGLRDSINENTDHDKLSMIIDYDRIMHNFLRWFSLSDYTPYDFTWGVGNTTWDSIVRYNEGYDGLHSGGTGERDNGNGSLMRILPIAFVISSYCSGHSIDENEMMNLVHDLSSLTHRHLRSQMACGIYVRIALELIENNGDMSLEEMIENGVRKARRYYCGDEKFSGELKHFNRIFDGMIGSLPRDEIKSGGYTISSLEASIWCILRNDSYRDTVLEAVNLGYDTDTTACVVGGLAGIYYGYEDIPGEWIETLARLDYLEGMIDGFECALDRFLNESEAL